MLFAWQLLSARDESELRDLLKMEVTLGILQRADINTQVTVSCFPLALDNRLHAYSIDTLPSRCVFKSNRMLTTYLSKVYTHCNADPYQPKCRPNGTYIVRVARVCFKSRIGYLCQCSTP